MVHLFRRKPKQQNARLLSVQYELQDEIDDALNNIEEAIPNVSEIAKCYSNNRSITLSQLHKEKESEHGRLSSKGYDPSILDFDFATWADHPALTRPESAVGFIKSGLRSAVTNIRHYFPDGENTPKRWNKADYAYAVATITSYALIIKAYAFPYSDSPYRDNLISASSSLLIARNRLLSTSYDDQAERFNLDTLSQQEQINNNMWIISKIMLVLTIVSTISTITALCISMSSCSDTDRLITATQQQTGEILAQLDRR